MASHYIYLLMFSNRSRKMSIFFNVRRSNARNSLDHKLTYTEGIFSQLFKTINNKPLPPEIIDKIDLNVYIDYLKKEGLWPQRIPRGWETNDETSAFWVACSEGHVYWVKKLLKNDKVDVNFNNGMSIQSASGEGDKEVVKILLEDGRADPSGGDSIALRRACMESPKRRDSSAEKKDYVEVVRLLIEDGRVDASAHNSECLRRAIINRNKDIVMLLLKDSRKEKRADPGAVYNWAINQACEWGDEEIMKTLLADERVNPAHNDNYPIKLACRNGHYNIVKLLQQDKRVMY